MTEVIVTEWKRYGHHRGYAADASGAKLGYVDLATGAVTLEDGVPTEPATTQLIAWASTHGAARLAERVPTPPTPTESAMVFAPVHATDEHPATLPQAVRKAVGESAHAWFDLAQNRPGQAVRAQQEAEWQASKDRSRFLAFGARAFDMNTQERAWRKGAEGEEYVGPKLETLCKHGWHVLHSVPVGSKDSDIDHIVIGPGGVFTINSKNHQGKSIWVADYAMMVDGRKVPYLRNSKYEAERSAKLLSKHLGFDVPVRGCIVVLTGSFVPEVTYKSRPVAASVLTKWDVPRWFRKQPRVLTQEQVDAIYEIARRSTTWH